MSVTDATQFYINGAFTASQGGTDMPIHNPSEDEEEEFDYEAYAREAAERRAKAREG